MTNPPKGGSKGGTRFPRVNLQKAHEYATRLVAKTHTGPQPENIILPGVFDAGGTTGQVRASALKQFHLLGGNTKGYFASELAQEIASATPEELPNRLKEALLKPKLFKDLFETFCNDTVSKAKIRQQAAKLKVHPDTLDLCLEVFVDSASYAGLATEKGDSVSFLPATDINPKSESPVGEGAEGELP